MSINGERIKQALTLAHNTLIHNSTFTIGFIDELISRPALYRQKANILQLLNSGNIPDAVSTTLDFLKRRPGEESIQFLKLLCKYNMTHIASEIALLAKVTIFDENYDLLI